MGQARHNKQFLTVVGPRTRGTGISYVNTPTTPEPTPEQLAAREMRQHEQCVLEAHKQRKQKIVEKIYGWAEGMVGVWRGELDKTSSRLRNFAGWTNDIFCPLPIDSEAAEVYRTVFAEQQARYGTLPLVMRDDIVETVFRREHYSDKIVAEVLRITRVNIEKAIDDEGFNVKDFLASLTKREIKERQRHDWVHKGLQFVVEMMEHTFQELARPKQ